MSIFDEIPKPISSNNTKGFYFGSPEAEGENVEGHKLLDYFEDFLGILDNLKQGKFIFTGRKGVGKSAIAKFIKDKSDSSRNSFATILRISDFEMQKSIQEISAEENLEALLFEWLILVNVVKLIIKDGSEQYTPEYIKLKKFLDTNAGFISIDKFQIDEGFKKSGGEVNFGVLTHAFGGVFKNYFDVKVTKAPFYKIIPPLKDIVKIILEYPINKGVDFWLLFDDLDINFDIKNEKDNKKIIELLRIAKIYNNEIFQKNNAKIIIFIRDDIRNGIISKYSDSAKIFLSYEILINWYDYYASSQDENNTALKAMADKRIALNFKNKGIKYKNPWETLFREDDYSSRSSFKNIIDFTFYRPRDIITFLSILGDVGYPFPINTSSLKNIIIQYISKSIKEIKSELNLFFSEEEKNIIFNKLFIYIIDNQPVNKVKLLDKIEEIGFSMTSIEVFEILISYSLIIYQNKSSNLIFNYRENNELDKYDTDELNVT